MINLEALINDPLKLDWVTLNVRRLDAIFNLAEAAEEATAVNTGSSMTPATHKSKFDGKPEKTSQSFNYAREDANLFFFISNSLSHFGGGMRAATEVNKGVRERIVCVHWNVTGNIVEDVGFRQIVERTRGADCNRSWEFTISKAIEEKKRRYITTYGFRAKTGERLEKAINIFQTWDAFRIKAEGTDTLQELGIGVFLPAREHTMVKAAPGLMIFLRIEFVRLMNVELAVVNGAFDKRGLSGGEAASRRFVNRGTAGGTTSSNSGHSSLLHNLLQLEPNATSKNPNSRNTRPLGTIHE